MVLKYYIDILAQHIIRELRATLHIPQKLYKELKEKC